MYISYLKLYRLLGVSVYDINQLDEGTPGRHCRISLYHSLFPPGFSGVSVILTPNKKDLLTLSYL